MAFIGIVSDHKEFEQIKRKLANKLKIDDWTIILINANSLENVKHIKFDTIIVTKVLLADNQRQFYWQKIGSQARYLIINGDIDFSDLLIGSLEAKVITYGFNPKSTVIASSVTEENMLIDVQRSFPKATGEWVETGERNFSLLENSKPEEALIVFIVSLLYQEV